MRTLRVDVTRYRGTTPGARSGVARASTREGLLVRVALSGGLLAQGEASPLPGYSSDGLEEVARALGRVGWDALPEPGEGSPMTGLAAVASSVASAPPSARFAIETAWLDAFGQRTSTPVWALLADESRRSGASIPLCTFAGSADDPSVLADVQRAAASAHTVKLKVAGPLSRETLDALIAVRSRLGAARLRLDANQSFEAKTAERDLERLATLDLDLLEEPLPMPALIGLPGSPVPLALDESLQHEGAWDALAPHLGRLRCAAVVLKPMALGGVAACLAHAAHARAHGLDVTVSHLFDGPVALAAAAHLAIAVATPSRASGLDRHAGLLAWPRTSLDAFLGTTMLTVTDAPGLGVSPIAEPP